MSQERRRQLEKDVAQQPWASDRFVRINQESNTISVYDTSFNEHYSVSNSVPEPPLTFQGITVVPHSFRYEACPFSPPAFTVPQNPARTSVDPVGLMQIVEKLGHIDIVDVYGDGELVFGVQDEFMEFVTQKLDGHDTFVAARLLYSSCLHRRRPPQPPKAPSQPTPVRPGAPIFNAEGEEPKVGVLLVERDTNNTAHQYFTVSAHSFLSKIQLLWPPSPILVFIACVGYVLVLPPVVGSILDVKIHIRFLLIRFILLFLYGVILARGYVQKRVNMVWSSYLCCSSCLAR
jgi:hypothetical protein